MKFHKAVTNEDLSEIGLIYKDALRCAYMMLGKSDSPSIWNRLTKILINKTFPFLKKEISNIPVWSDNWIGVLSNRLYPVEEVEHDGICWTWSCNEVLLDGMCENYGLTVEIPILIGKDIIAGAGVAVVITENDDITVTAGTPLNVPEDKINKLKAKRIELITKFKTTKDTISHRRSEVDAICEDLDMAEDLLREAEDNHEKIKKEIDEINRQIGELV